MSLGVVRSNGDAAVGYASRASANGCGIYEPWKNWEPSPISHHGSVCCEVAKEWFSDTDFSFLNGGKLYSGPRWLRQRFGWGPGAYPVTWCEVLKKKSLDCGVHAALAHEAFLQRGIKTYRAQFVQEFSACAASQWRLSWEKDEAVTAWIRDDLIYHEGCAVDFGEKQVKLWDSSAGWWIDPKTTSGYGAIRALRIVAGRPETFRWGRHVLEADEWAVLH